MRAERDENDVVEALRRASRTGIQTSEGIIVDRARVAKLTAELLERRQKKIGSERVSVDAEGVSEKTMTEATTGAAERSGIQALAGPEITGIEIGSGQSPDFVSLDGHYGKICECQKCPLGATRTKFVYGVGSPTADLMFVGEAPGKNEDLQGEPFVGRAGQLLDKILAAINLTRPEIYIANILKCRPPGNRDPQPDEMEHCFPYLKEQIALVRPKILCSLGRISAQALLQTKLPLGKMRNQWHSYQGIPLRVTYHPAALLRNPNFKRGCWEDMQVIEAEYERLAG
jgi:uracil-DNA glycosylase